MANSVQELLKNVEAELLEVVYVAFQRAVPALQEQLSQAVSKAVIDGPVARRIMTDSKLQGDLGLVRPANAVASIAAAVGAATRVELERDAQSVSLSLHAFKKDFSDALQSSGAEYRSQTMFNTTVIKWLEWILFGRYEALTASYGVFHLKKASIASRTYLNVMLPLKGGIKKGFKLDSTVEGTADSNWLTQAASTLPPILVSMLEDVFRKASSSL